MTRRTAIVSAGLVVLLAVLVGLLLWWPRSIDVAPPAEPTEVDANWPHQQTLPASGHSPIAPRRFDEVESAESKAESSAAQEDVVISGQVLDFDGSPAADASLSLWPMAGGIPTSRWRLAAHADADGRFQISVAGMLRTECVLVASRGGRRPATLTLTRGAAEWKRNIVLRLGQGASITGVVRLDGEPVREATVRADLAYGKNGQVNCVEEVWWAEGAFELKAASVSTDDHGAFAITGLARSTFQIDVRIVVPGQSLDVGRSCRKSVAAPATGVELSAESGRLRIHVLGDGKPMVAAQVAVVSNDGGIVSVEKLESVEIRVEAEQSLTVQAVAPGFEPNQIVVSPLRSREVRDADLPLQSREARRLFLTLRGARAMGLEVVRVRFFPDKVAVDEEMVAVQRLRSSLQAKRIRDDEFLLDDVPYPPGRYAVAVVPEFRSSWLIPAYSEIEVAASGATTVTLNAVTGGSVNFAIFDFNGRPAYAECILRDSSREEVVSRTMSGEFLMRSGGPTALGGLEAAKALCRSWERFPPGDYDLEVTSPGYRTAKRSITIAGGSATREEVRLEREKP